MSEEKPMAARKTRKVAEPSVEESATEEAQETVQASSEPESEPEVLAASTFPVPKDDFLGPKTMSRRIHDDQKAVRRLQERFGHTSNGIWNRPLADEVIRFQQENGLQVTGLVDRATWAALFDEQ